MRTISLDLHDPVLRLQKTSAWFSRYPPWISISEKTYVSHSFENRERRRKPHKTKKSQTQQRRAAENGRGQSSECNFHVRSEFCQLKNYQGLITQSGPC